MFSSWPVCAFVDGVKIGSGSRSDSRQALGQHVPADLAGREVVLPARAGDVAAHDALERQHLEPPALGRAAVVAQREQMVRDDVLRPREPEAGEPGEHAALVRDLGGKDDVEGRDAVARDEQQPLVVECVDLADLSACDVCGLRHALAPLRGCGDGRRRRRRAWCRRSRRRRRRGRPRISGSARTSVGKSWSSSHARIAWRCTSRYASSRSSPDSTSASSSRCEK